MSNTYVAIRLAFICEFHFEITFSPRDCHKSCGFLPAFKQLSTPLFLIDNPGHERLTLGTTFINDPREIKDSCWAGWTTSYRYWTKSCQNSKFWGEISPCLTRDVETLKLLWAHFSRRVWRFSLTSAAAQRESYFQKNFSAAAGRRINTLSSGPFLTTNCEQKRLKLQSFLPGLESWRSLFGQLRLAKMLWKVFPVFLNFDKGDKLFVLIPKLLCSAGKKRIPGFSAAR